MKKHIAIVLVVLGTPTVAIAYTITAAPRVELAALLLMRSVFLGL